MKAKVYRVSLLLAALLVLAAAAAVWSLSSQNRGGADVPSPPSPQAVALYQYYLQEYEGKIGVFRMNETSPIRVLDVYVSTLPSLDQLELREGVYVPDEAKLRIILEDYGS